MEGRLVNNMVRISVLMMAVAAVVSACPGERRPKDEIRRRKMRRMSETIRKRGPGRGKPRVGPTARRLPRIKIPRPVVPPVQPFAAVPAVFKLLGKGSGRTVQLRYNWRPGLTAVYQGKLEQLTVAPRHANEWNWLPPTLLQSVLPDAKKLGEWSIASSPPRLVVKRADGKVFTGTYRLQCGARPKVTVTMK